MLLLFYRYRNPITTENFLSPVEESEIEEPLDDASIICLVQEENNDENQNEEEDSDEESELPAIPIKEGLEALEKVMTCLLQQHKDCPDVIKKLTSVKNTMKKIYNDSLEQSTLDCFFENKNLLNLQGNTCRSMQIYVCGIYIVEPELFLVHMHVYVM